MEIRSEIGARLREERDRLGLSQAEVAALAQATRNTVAQWEKGATAPAADSLAVLAQRGVDLSYVVLGRRDGLFQRQVQRMGAEDRSSSYDGDGSGNGGGSPPPGRPRLTAAERLLLDAYRALSDPDRAVLERVAQSLAEGHR